MTPPTPSQGSFELGTTFLLNVSQAHLRAVISDPQDDPENVVIVSLTTWREGKDASCKIERGEHPFVTHSTCVDYRHAMSVTVTQLLDGKDKGDFSLREKLSKAVLQRILGGAASTTQLPNACRIVLQSQGLIP